jgi:tRNA(Ile2) C34 agmatinyltransferase TiaS
VGDHVIASVEDRSLRRRRKALHAQVYREQDRSIAEIARLLGQAPATVKAYLSDPTGKKARAIKERYSGTCEVCGAATSAADGKGRASRRCQRCKPQALTTWTRERVRAAHRAWYERFGFVASSYDWSGTHARRHGDAALERFEAGDWPSGPVIRRL